jgi:hypothetical protein
MYYFILDGKPEATKEKENQEITPRTESTIKESQRPWMWPFFFLHFFKQKRFLVGYTTCCANNTKLLPYQMKDFQIRFFFVLQLSMMIMSQKSQKSPGKW